MQYYGIFSTKVDTEAKYDLDGGIDTNVVALEPDRSEHIVQMRS